MLREENARLLWDLMSRRSGAPRAHFYVCGRTGFASTVALALEEIARRHAPADGGDGREVMYRLAGEGRYKQDVFTTYSVPQVDKTPTYDASEIVLHNGDESGYWMVVSGRVYDVTNFSQLHPGGFKILRAYAGMDATRAYRKVLHHANPEVHSTLGMYEIGAVRRLDFGGEWGTAIGPRGLQHVPLADVYRAWVRYLYTLVEMENALHNDFTLRERPLTRGDVATSSPPLKLQLLLEVHDRFLVNYLESAMGEPLADLWAVTVGVCRQDQEDSRWMADTVAAIQRGQEASTVRRLSAEIASRIAEIAAQPDSREGEPHPMAEFVNACCDLLEREDKRFLRELKMAIRSGVQLFEAHERRTTAVAGSQVVERLRSIPRSLESYHSRVLSGALSVLLPPSPG
jgi:sulfite reductase (NADPH) flavoprotein alpha-component